MEGFGCCVRVLVRVWGAGVRTGLVRSTPGSVKMSRSRVSIRVDDSAGEMTGAVESLKP